MQLMLHFHGVGIDPSARTLTRKGGTTTDAHFTDYTAVALHHYPSVAYRRMHQSQYKGPLKC